MDSRVNASITIQLTAIESTKPVDIVNKMLELYFRHVGGCSNETSATFA